jgi:hypothetical protein
MGRWLGDLAYSRIYFPGWGRKQANRNFVLKLSSEIEGFKDVEDRVTRSFMGKREYPLRSLRDLADLGVSRRDHAVGIGAQLRIRESVSRRVELGLRRFQASLGRQQRLLGLVKRCTSRDLSLKDTRLCGFFGHRLERRRLVRKEIGKNGRGGGGCRVFR